eukprot:TRINITY_DN15904_c0_g1_i1.p1 TRINITY_DN15904_c0_g1~~TRINITY_DN15904_c0_g1_i1.p1  ORF type:complete len:266 (-),score=43.10 TRINITY_DN15904_c0_g1_i1:75-824(-)
MFVKGTEKQDCTIDNSTKFYTDAAGPVISVLENLSLYVAEIGQRQLLRKQLANILAFKCKLDSNTLLCSLEIMNRALVNDVHAHYRNKEKPYPGGENSVLFTEVAKYLENVGLNDPFGKIYVTTEVLFDLAAIMFLLLLKQIGKFTFEAHLGVKPVKKSTIDDSPFAIGVMTLMKQFHSSVIPEFFAYIGQYIKSLLNDTLENPKTTTYPVEVQKILLFVEVFIKFGNIERSIVEEYIPAYVFTEFLPK